MTEEEKKTLTVFSCGRIKEPTNKNQPKFKCVQCKAYYESSLEWKNHMKEAHPPRNTVGEEYAKSGAGVLPIEPDKSK